MPSLSVKITSKLKEKLEILKEELGFQTLSDTINCLVERHISINSELPIKPKEKE